MDDISEILPFIFMFALIGGAPLFFWLLEIWDKYKQYNDLMRRKNFLERENKKIKTECEKLKSEYEDLQDELNIKKKADECLRDTVYWMNRSIELAQENKNLRKDLEQCDKAMQNIQNKPKEQGTAIRMLLDKIKEKEEIISKFDTELKILQAKLEIFQKEKCFDRLHKLTQVIVEKELEDFDKLVIHLKNKINPAFSSAQKAAEAKRQAKIFDIKYKLMKYEYDLLFELFPELENYIETIDGSTTEEQSLEDVKADYDWSIKWLSEEEYHNLPVDERNQLALDRYIESRKKSKWQIGRDFEMYIGYLYETDGYKVTYTGIEKKLEDMGRDLIAENDKEVLIIQCKYWSKDKVIHEKHICQLYGTAIHYKRTNNIKKNVKPVFVTKTSLSDTAKDFADYLKVKIIENKELEEFPRIKCNIGKGGEKIYHLPFDQQYDRTIIDKIKGECFASTVEEAVNKGFRRAKKYYG